MKKYPLFLLTAALLPSCFHSTHLPHDPGTPWPDPHDGVFVAGGDTLTFNGDGESVTWHLTQESLSIGQEGRGTYVFKHNHGSWRYDAAERLELADGQGNFEEFLLDVPGNTNDSTIVLLRTDLPDSPAQTFRKVSSR